MPPEVFQNRAIPFFIDCLVIEREIDIDAADMPGVGL
jgi:hypothetical protein